MSLKNDVGSSSLVTQSDHFSCTLERIVKSPDHIFWLGSKSAQHTCSMLICWVATNHAKPPNSVHSASVRRTQAGIGGHRGGEPRRRNGLADIKIFCLDNSAVRRLVLGMAKVGIGQTLHAQLHLRSCSAQVQFSELLNGLCEALDRSPEPAQEWRALHEALEADMPARLLDISESGAK